jgi:type IV pilus assembly protein PilA
VSDAPQGPGWWQASDGRWYPPQPPAASYAPAGPPPPASGKAKTALGLAISSFVICPIVGAVASLFVGRSAKREIEQSQGKLGGEGLVTASRVLSIVHLAGLLVMIPVLAAIAIPTFLGARERAQDRAAQSNLRNALTAEKTHFVDAGAWTDDPAVLSSFEPALRFVRGERPQPGGGVIAVVLDGEIVGLSTKSQSGTCFYLMDTAVDGSTIGDSIGFAEDDSCGRAQDQSYNDGWDSERENP